MDSLLGSSLYTVDEFIQDAGKDKQFQALLKDIQEADLEGGALDKACNELQELVSSLKPPQQLCKDVGGSVSILLLVQGYNAISFCNVLHHAMSW